MSFQERKNQILELLRYGNELDNVFGKNSKDDVRKTVDTVIQHLSCLEGGGSVAVGPTDIQRIYKITDILLERAMNGPINDWVRDFANVYTILLSNWIDNVTQDEELRKKAECISRLINANYAIRDLLKMVNELKIDRRNRGATELSRHYMRTLDE